MWAAPFSFGQNPYGWILNKLQVPDGLCRMSCQKSIAVIHFSGDKHMNQFFQILFCHKVPDFGNVFKVVKCWFCYCLWLLKVWKGQSQLITKVLNLLFVFTAFPFRWATLVLWWSPDVWWILVSGNPSNSPIQQTDVAIHRNFKMHTDNLCQYLFYLMTPVGLYIYENCR